MFLELKLLNFFAVRKTVLKSWNEAKIGQGLGDTKWKGTIILVDISIY